MVNQLFCEKISISHSAQNQRNNLQETGRNLMGRLALRIEPNGEDCQTDFSTCIALIETIEILAERDENLEKEK